MGLVPATVAPFIIRRTGAGHARRLMLWAQPFGPAEALEAGLVDMVAGPGEADKKIRELCRLVRRNAPDAVSGTKKLLIDLENDSLPPDPRRFLAGLSASARRSGEAREGIRAFFERREPAWRKIDPAGERQGKPAPDGDQ